MYLPPAKFGDDKSSGFYRAMNVNGALKPGFRSLATLKLVVNVVGEL